MVRSHPILTACALGLLLPTPATAGPIEWEVSAQLARVGDASGPWAWSLTPEFIGGGSTIHEQTFSRLAAEGPHAGWGSQSVRVGSLFPDGPSYDPLHGAPGDFEVKIALTDRGSGQAGTVVFAGFGWEVLEQDYDNWGVLLSRRSLAELRGETEQPLTLDGNEYRVGLRAVERDGIVDFFADVSVGDAVATPEPGTLALAALGLGALGLRRRFRRGVVALVSLLLIPQFASAGPLSWGFRAEAPDGTVLREVTGLTDLAYSDFFFPDPRTHGVYNGGETHPISGHYFKEWESEARVVVTDERSGASGDFRLWHAWVEQYEVRPGGTHELIYEGETGGPWFDPVRLTLGGNLYEARGPGGELVINVTPGVATPEPGTLALAALGLGALGLRRRFRRGTAAAVVLLLAPQFASAGPISWGVRAEAPDGTVLRTVGGITDPFYSDLFLSDPQYHGVFAGGVSDPHFRSERWETEARVTITDEVSGASGEFRLWWRWVKEYEVRPDGSEDQFYEGYNSGPWPDPVRLTLGGNVYEARGPGGELRVTVEPGVATPEPGTLALAGLGLGVIGVVRRRTGRPASRPPSGGG